MIHKPHSKQILTQNSTSTVHAFAKLGIQKELCHILQQKKIAVPTPIQEQTIPVVLSGNDCIGIAQTGTGKTLAFVLPMVHYLYAHPTKKALIVVPTRELAYQVDEVCRWFSERFQLRPLVIVGGASMHQQIQILRKNPRIIVATPGRLRDHLQQKTLRLREAAYIVLDEADRMFDMGFAPQIQAILKEAPPVQERQTLLFSATLPDAIMKLALKYMRTPIRIEATPIQMTPTEIHQEMVVIDHSRKKQALISILQAVHGTTIVFIRTKHQASRLTKDLRAAGYTAEELHSNRSLAQRRRAMDAIQSRRAQILVATDIAARGIDITHIEVVINYDLPESPEDYVHRIGRTGRAGRSGRAISFVCSDQGDQLKSIQRLMNIQIKQVHLDAVPTVQLQYTKQPSSKRGGRGHSNFRGGRKFSYGRPHKKNRGRN
ncbi:MAG TPA: DEAD/DEAH box helicase [Patescibacteria group bacterium]|nr:DEAD/DEAH box helicase [Patescibacteria group bacterium]